MEERFLTKALAASLVEGTEVKGTPATMSGDWCVTGVFVGYVALGGHCLSRFLCLGSETSCTESVANE